MHPTTRALPVVLTLLVAMSGCRAGDRDTLLEGSAGSNAMVLDEARLVDLTYAGENGTRVVAPRAHAPDGWTVAEIPLEQLVGPAVVLDVSDSVNWNPGYRLTESAILAWERVHGPIRGGALVFLRTGWSKHWSDPPLYFASETPGLAEEAARFLVQERFVDAVGSDTPSIDGGPAPESPALRILAEANVPAFENVANLRHLPETGAWVMALPQKLVGASAAPLRLMAVLPPPPETP